MTNQKKRLYSLFFVILLAACGLIGSRFLSWIAPWRETEIYFAATLAFLSGLGVWQLGRRKPLIRRALLVVTVLLFVGFTYAHYLVFIAHYQKEFPSIYEHIDLGDKCKEKVNILTSTKQEKLVALVQNSRGFRARLFKFLNSPVNDANLLTEADEILASQYQYFAYEPAQLPHDLYWTEDPYGDRIWNMCLHCMDYVVTLARAFEKSGNTVYLKRAEDLILDWISDNTRYIFKPPSEFSWNDHSTALRLLNWLYFFDVWKSSELVTLERLESFLRALLGHALLLSDKSFYTHNHNHGIDQDRALLAFSLMHPYTVESEQWQKLALSRLLKQIHFAVSPRGIHLEHSPGYHLFGMRQLQKTLSFLELWGVRHKVVDIMRKNIVLMAEYVPNIVRSDGHLAQIGDTQNNPITDYRQQLAPLATSLPVLRELIETGSTQYLSNIAQAFPEEGYAVIRDFGGARLDFRNSFYLFFTAGAHEGRAHRQADDLSFVLSYGGREILVDPGVYSYKRDAGRKYVTSTAAHNTVVLDGTRYKGCDTRLDSFIVEDRYTLIHSSHRNYPDFIHVRWLLYLRPALMFLIDRMQPLSSSMTPRSHHFDQMFHFAPDLHVEIDAVNSFATVLTGRFDSRPVIILTQLSELKPSMRVAIGEQSPMQGWHSPAYAKLVPAPALISSLDGRSAEYITALEIPLQRQGSQEFDNTRRRFQAVTKAGIVSIRWSEGEKIQNLILDLNTNNISYD